MCGIAGISSNEPGDHSATIMRMTDALRHRGPDGYGFVALDPGDRHVEFAESLPSAAPHAVMLGHRRLAIIDPAGTPQPLCNEDGTVWVVFNGEIYNYPELRRQLAAKGHHLREAGDTEVLVHLWEEYGTDMPARLNGMFAFAIYDVNRDLLFLARDRFGQKPLYYWQHTNGLAFASELQALHHVTGFPRDDIDDIAAAQYLRYGYIPSPRTIYRAVHALRPGATLTWRRRTSTPGEYWRPIVHGQPECGSGHNDIEHLIDDAVEIRLRADVPVAAFLSGGIDSSVVVSSAARISGKPIQTFTVGTGRADSDESGRAAAIAQHVGADHRHIVVSPNLIDIMTRLTRHFGQPFADYSSVPTYYVSRETAAVAKVALSGDGGDEIFAGYNHYRRRRWSEYLAILSPQHRVRVVEYLSKLPLARGPVASQVRDFVLSATATRNKGENHSGYFHDYWRHRCFTADFLSRQEVPDALYIDQFTRYYDEATSSDVLEKWLEADQRMYLCDDILTKVDIASMAVSLECRAPLLDHRIAERANTMAVVEKLSGQTSKIPLRRMLDKRLPRSLFDAPKKGFTIPLSQWTRNDRVCREWLHDIIFTGSNATWTKYIRYEAAERMWETHQSGRHDHTMRLWMIAMWNLWYTEGR